MVVHLTVTRPFESVDDEVIDWVDLSFVEDMAEVMSTPSGASDMDLSFYGGTGWLSKKAQLILRGPLTDRVRAKLDDLPDVHVVHADPENGGGRGERGYRLELSKDLSTPL